MENQIQSKILEYFSQNGNFAPGISDDEKLDAFYLDSGVIDSLGIIELVVFLEETFSVQFSSDDMQSSDFRTIRGLMKLINKLKA